MVTQFFTSFERIVLMCVFVLIWCNVINFIKIFSCFHSIDWQLFVFKSQNGVMLGCVMVASF